MALGPPLFDLRGVTIARGEQALAQDLNLQLHAGERVGLSGPNGCGKTTLLQVMVGLRAADAGQVNAFGRTRRSEQDFREVRRRAGLLFQDADDQLFCPTVAEDVAFGPLNLGRTHAQTEAIVERCLTELGILALRNRLAYRLSGGEKRLVALAAVLAMEPDVLLLDEPTSGLDSRAQQRLLAVLRQRRESLLVVSHDQPFMDQLVTRRLHFQQRRLEPSVCP